MAAAPRPMKFWELVSAFRTSSAAVDEVLGRPEWREPYAGWYASFDALVSRQDRAILDAPVPLELSREVARRCELRFQYSPRHGVLRESWAGISDAGPVVEMTALEVHDQFGGWVIEEVFEFGSLRVARAEVETPVQTLPPAPEPRPKAPPTPTAEELAERIRALQAELVHHPGDKNREHALATALVSAERYAEAIPLYLSLADFFHRDGFVTNARGYLRIAARLDPENPDVRARMDDWGQA